MGNCCCGDRKKKKRKCKKSKKRIEPMDVSNPSDMDTNDITIVHELKPNQTFEDLLTQNGYKLLEPIGSGAFAQVYKSEVILESSSLRKGQIIACKVVNLSAKQSLNKCLKEVKNELFILEKIRHPNIIELYDHFMIGEKTLYIFMQYANGGDLGQHLIKCGPFPEEAVKLWFAQILSAVSYMHSEGIAHRDLKLNNILLDHNNKDNKALLTDFGLSRVCRRRPKPGRKGGTEWSSTFCGTMPYMAPEILMTVNIFYDPFPADVWALGIILFILFNSGYPFDFNDKHKMLKQQLRRRIKWNLNRNPSNQLKDIVLRILEPDPYQRIKTNELVKHKWIRDELKMIQVIKSKESMIQTKQTLK